MAKDTLFSVSSLGLGMVYGIKKETELIQSLLLCEYELSLFDATVGGFAVEGEVG